MDGKRINYSELCTEVEYYNNCDYCFLNIYEDAKGNIRISAYQNSKDWWYIGCVLHTKGSYHNDIVSILEELVHFYNYITLE